ncbi:MAG: phosphoribosylaminoimidazolesuccinocarboxamide synthase [Planctomycetes bacterium]|nr:phosphoribosylaminoimidazolesuccinocarboxamide synthase [Planctomycetota bacterium]
MDAALFESNIPGLPKPKRGKVRDVYKLGKEILLVATDRISAFDVVFPTPIPDKGRILTSLSLFWLDLLKDVVPNHLISANLSSLNLPPEEEAMLQGRAVLVKKAQVVPFECIVRGYIIGSGWKEYQSSGAIAGLPLPAGLKIADKLPEPIFTPSTKAESGHDENISFEAMRAEMGETADRIRDISLELYRRASEYALSKGIIIADTKFEFGFYNHELMLVDEILTPDSSRFWPLNDWRAGENPPSFDKQYLRDWLEKECCWNKRPPAPTLPEKVVAKTRQKYLEAHEILTGRKLGQ